MIQSINVTGKYMMVQGQQTYNSYGTISNAIGPSNMRYNNVTCQIEVFDGSLWKTINSMPVGIGLSYEAEQLLDWAKTKRAEEQMLEQLAKNNVTIASLLQDKKVIEEKIKMVEILTREDTKPE